MMGQVVLKVCPSTEKLKKMSKTHQNQLSETGRESQVYSDQKMPN